VFEGHNNWEIVPIHRGETPEEEMEDVYATVLESIANVMATEIRREKTGAVSTVEDKYYLVTWTGLPYRVEGDQFLQEYDPPIHVKDGELVCKGVYLEGLYRAKGWYHPTKIRTVVWLQQVLAAAVKLSPIEAPNNLLPRGWPQHEPPFGTEGKTPARLAQLQQAEESIKISENDHDEILEELRQQQLLDYEEEEETDNKEEDEVSSDDTDQCGSDNSDWSVEDERK
jgi:hypothetical protein